MMVHRTITFGLILSPSKDGDAARVVDASSFDRLRMRRMPAADPRRKGV